MDAANWGKKKIADFNVRKTKLGSFEQFMALVLFMQKWMGLFLK